MKHPKQASGEGPNEAQQARRKVGCVTRLFIVLVTLAVFFGIMHKCLSGTKAYDEAYLNAYKKTESLFFKESQTGAAVPTNEKQKMANAMKAVGNMDPASKEKLAQAMKKAFQNRKPAEKKPLTMAEKKQKVNDFKEKVAGMVQKAENTVTGQNQKGKEQSKDPFAGLKNMANKLKDFQTAGTQKVAEAIKKLKSPGFARSAKSKGNKVPINGKGTAGVLNPRDRIKAATKAKGRGIPTKARPAAKGNNMKGKGKNSLKDLLNKKRQQMGQKQNPLNKRKDRAITPPIKSDLGKAARMRANKLDSLSPPKANAKPNPPHVVAPKPELRPKIPAQQNNVKPQAPQAVARKPELRQKIPVRSEQNKNVKAEPTKPDLLKSLQARNERLKQQIQNVKKEIPASRVAVPKPDLVKDVKKPIQPSRAVPKPNAVNNEQRLDNQIQAQKQRLDDLKAKVQQAIDAQKKNVQPNANH